MLVKHVWVTSSDMLLGRTGATFQYRLNVLNMADWHDLRHTMFHYEPDVSDIYGAVTLTNSSRPKPHLGSLDQGGQGYGYDSSNGADGGFEQWGLQGEQVELQRRPEAGPVPRAFPPQPLFHSAAAAGAFIND